MRKVSSPEHCDYVPALADRDDSPDRKTFLYPVVEDDSRKLMLADGYR